ncbi:MAG: N-acetylmuramoyl-L-alanine amidase [Candidatus Krumholzibacteriia bacterium]|jgi:N-acetylmuramoyl-L-alanine amidase
MNRQLAIFLIFGGALIGLLSACAGPQKIETIAPTAGYLELQEQLGERDVSSLQDRRIVLDPGHGGYFRGALGPNGLTEAEVNLGVALHLRGLLEWAGAEVWLTRSSNSDFLTPADSTLASDLAMRVSLSDSLQPDVFISLHHNSTASLDRTINETQTYYPLNDDGASLDLARSIHRHLVINLAIEPASILPGNFHVLRNATVPAVLGEPAMISHPVMAERLSFAASQRLEAEAYFLGLLDYFDGGLPAWSGAARDTVVFGAETEQNSIAWRFLPDGENTDSTAPSLDPSTLVVSLDEDLQVPSLSPSAFEVSWNIPADLAPKPHLLTIQGRNLAGRATPLRQTLLIPQAGTAPHVEILRQNDSDRTGIVWRSATGGPLPKGILQIGQSFTAPVGPGLPTAIWAAIAPSDEISFLPAEATQPLPIPRNVTTLSAEKTLRLPILENRAYLPWQSWRSRLSNDTQGTFLVVSAGQPVWMESRGVQPLIDPDPQTKNKPRTVPRESDNWPVVPLLPGLMGKKIVLDPAGGGTNSDGTGPLGLRGSDLNLQVAIHAAQLLRGAGAIVHLTRNGETQLPAVEKVRLAGKLGADLFLTIGRRHPDQPRAAWHHHGSPTGKRWAEAAASAAALLPAAEPANAMADSFQVAPSSAYLLRHTACPALAWTFDPPETDVAEMLQLQPGWQRAEARAIMLAFAVISGHPEIMTQLINMPEILDLVARQGGPAADSVEWAMLDGNLMWSPLPPVHSFTSTTDTLNSLTGPGLPARLKQHVLEIHAGQQWQLWLLTKNEDSWRPILMLSSNDRSTLRATQ